MAQDPTGNAPGRLLPTRLSASADEARRASLDKIRALTARQRVELALALGRRSEALARAKPRKAEQAP